MDIAWLNPSVFVINGWWRIMAASQNPPYKHCVTANGGHMTHIIVVATYGGWHKICHDIITMAEIWKHCLKIAWYYVCFNIHQKHCLKIAWYSLWTHLISFGVLNLQVEIAQPLSKLCLEFPDLCIGMKFMNCCDGFTIIWFIIHHLF